MTKLSTDERRDLNDSQFAFSAQRKEPLESAAHVRNAVARFNQVRGVTDSDKDAAWQRILDAATQFGVSVKEVSWHDLPAARPPH
jgi:hypothetical protein